ncbi:hypothetical protein [Acrocarpospora sp. B8E8]|uniref:hypothetical protein n=1 Tax=Acrocarpospora sp. B8E8 TaxID=3153572 RepID=UPI00325D1076
MINLTGERSPLLSALPSHREMRGDAPDFKEFLLADPDWDDDLDFPRAQDVPRETDLGIT